MHATATLGGTFDVYTLDTTITGSALTWAGQSIDKVTAKAMVTGEAIDVTSLSLTQGAGFLDGRVRYAWETGAYDAHLKGDRLSWRGTVLTPNDTQAMFSLQFDGAGTAAKPGGQAKIDFVLTGGTAGAFIGNGDVTVDLLGDHARIAARLPELGATVDAQVATASPYDYRATAVLDRFEIARLATLTNAIPGEILGFVSGNVTASGRLADDRDRVAVFDLQALDAGIGGIPVSLMTPARVTLRGSDVTLQDLNMRVGSGRLSASGEMTRGSTASFAARSTASSRTPSASARRSACQPRLTAPVRSPCGSSPPATAPAPSPRLRSRTARSTGARDRRPSAT